MTKQERFFSYFDKEKQYNGMKFEIIRKMGKEDNIDEESGNQYLIRLENGKEIQAYEEEIDGSYEEYFKKIK